MRSVLVFVESENGTLDAKGGEGERRHANLLERIVGARGVVLHDRRVPGTQGNIDHIAVVLSGIWIVDAKKYKGKVKQKDVGGTLRKDTRLYVGGRDLQDRRGDGVAGLGRCQSARRHRRPDSLSPPLRRERGGTVHQTF